MQENEGYTPEDAEKFKMPSDADETQTPNNGQTQEQEADHFSAIDGLSPETSKAIAQARQEKKEYQRTKIEWPKEFPQELLKHLPTELLNGKLIKSTIDFQKDGEGRIVSASYREEDASSTNDTSNPQITSKEITISYNDKNQPRDVKIMAFESDDPMLRGERPLGHPQWQEQKYSLTYHLFGRDKGTFKALKSSYENLKSGRAA